eukprot:CAMPEP_0184241688 /NCGR_PEP_ID=MMETSP0976-20121227/28526_1 /TAXON_ID=483370 /ORGANISM="non described non described, Strain CCMP2097" /LENGTH=68 /DNA_ID=CAMNT_0026546935 /DNA_START=121 /DNA_END=327 /DNA_ORIENTATION=-
MTHAEIEERFRLALRPHGFDVRLRHAHALEKNHAQIVLRVCIALLGRASVPQHGGLVVDLDAEPFQIT